MDQIFVCCPNCERKQWTRRIDEQRILNIRSDDIEVNVHLLYCLTCHEEFEENGNPCNELDEAYRKYRAKHGMLQPEQIVEIREKAELSREEFAKTTGMTTTEVRSYELGSLQEKEVDELIRKFR